MHQFSAGGDATVITGDEGQAAKRQRLNEAHVSFGGGALPGSVLLPGKGFNVGNMALDPSSQQQLLSLGGGGTIGLAPGLTSMVGNGHSQSLGSTGLASAGTGSSSLTVGNHPAISGQLVQPNGFAAISGLFGLNVQDALQMYSNTNRAGKR
jgi:hypothetical protein